MKKKSMPRQSGAKEPSREASKSPTTRVKWILQAFYDGNRSAMARALQCSHTAINLVVGEKQEPGRDLLGRIAYATGVNPGWLLTGLGKALTTTNLPVSDEILPGSPTEHSTSLVGQLQDLGDYYSPTRYWLRIRPDHPILQSNRSMLCKGDLLLIETNPAALELPGGWEGICAIQRDPATTPELMWAVLDNDREEYLDCWSFRRTPSERIIVEREPGGRLKAFDQIPSRTELDDAHKQALLLVRYKKDKRIVGICLLATRIYVPLRWLSVADLPDAPKAPNARAGQGKRARNA